MNPTNTQKTVRAHGGSVRYLYLPAAVAAIGGLLFGFDTAVINGAIVFLKRQFALSDSQTEIGASSLLLGCVFGASLAAFTSDRFGRKKLLLAAAALFTISSIATALPRNITEFVVARLVGGIAIGVASTLSPLYIAEIAPARIRGRAMSITTVFLWCGTLLVTLTFLSLVRVLTAPGAFLLYAVICIAALLFVKLAVPETKGRSLEEIESWWLARRGEERANLIRLRLRK